MPFGKPFKVRKRDTVDNEAFALDLLTLWLTDRGYVAADVVTAVWSVPAGIVLSHESWNPATGEATAWISGGTTGQTYQATLTVTLPPPAVGKADVVKRFALDVEIVAA